MRTNISSGSPWESIVGYSRVVKIGNNVAVSGTTAFENGEVIGKNSPYEQTKYILEKIISSIAKVGAKPEHIIRTRIFVTNIEHWEEIGRCHGEFFSAILPVTTMVEVKALIHPDMLVEIEADAIME